MKDGIFRKTALKKISSPENLNQYIRGTKPMSWFLLLGICVIIAGACVWGFAGVIPETVSTGGVAFSDTAEVSTAYAYLPLSVATRISVGMDVQVSPDYAHREEYGYIYGTIAEIGTVPVSTQSLQERYGNPSYWEGLVPAGNAVEVRVDLKSTDGSLDWSSAKGQSVVLENGAYCNLSIVVREQRPIDVLIRGN